MENKDFITHFSGNEGNFTCIDCRELVRIGVGHEVGHEESIYRNLDLIVNSPIGLCGRKTRFSVPLWPRPVTGTTKLSTSKQDTSRESRYSGTSCRGYDFAWVRVIQLSCQASADRLLI